MEDETYFSMTAEKIEEWEQKLKAAKNLTKREKKMYMNRISAQKSRLKKKSETQGLQAENDALRAELDEMKKKIDTQLCGNCREVMLNGGSCKRVKHSSSGSGF